MMKQRCTRRTTFLISAVLTSLCTVASVQADDEEGSLRYVPPITNPVYNESPYITTEARPFYMYNAIPGGFISNGGHINMWALQLRFAVTDRLALIATKDGYADIDFASSSPIPDTDGFANIAFGLKYALLANAKTNSFFSVGLRYEAPTGDLETAGIRLQGAGDGFINVFMSGAWLVRDKVGIQASFGLNMAVDSKHDSSFVHSSIHGDYELLRGLFLVSEFNMISNADEGSRTDASVLGSFEGYDLVNFGNTDPGTVFTYGAGARYRLNDHLQFGAAYEIPLGGREDIIDYRVTVDMILQL